MEYLKEFPHRKVKLTKVSTLEGRPMGYSDGYWVIGEVITPIEVGKSVVILREENSKGRVFGIFSTSKVVSFGEVGDKAVIRTSNSMYEMETL
jgi:hypothetical protein